MSAGYDVIGLLKMVKDVAHDQTEAKQTVVGFLESTSELFTYHQGKKVSGNDYSIMCNVSVKSIKVHGGKPWHHPGLAEMHTKKIEEDMTRAEGFNVATLPTAHGARSSRL